MSNNYYLFHRYKSDMFYRIMNNRYLFRYRNTLKKLSQFYKYSIRYNTSIAGALCPRKSAITLTWQTIIICSTATSQTSSIAQWTIGNCSIIVVSFKNLLTYFLNNYLEYQNRRDIVSQKECYYSYMLNNHYSIHHCKLDKFDYT